jgi:hypothetical protein
MYDNRQNKTQNVHIIIVKYGFEFYSMAIFKLIIQECYTVCKNFHGSM